ncbi:xanthine dehydrogenase family protein molybdopterin-binding subunit [Caenimonas soli]|uniref:xanthine dehydrogenase family protein molybdopterin-binding subunit n=1 Tax=Caenimonas soli TaxID=2735555 RepID=UPI001552466B|nr:xanthine dehydrogenase family protein molybdopterin-binding subunit [Caenimonas soli]NPC54895.1 xanthine dehydrogenase family protein molybdopterin-binding subunit [Caenimonas soli]
MTKLDDAAHGNLIGRSVTRREDPPLLTGRGRFTDDIAVGGLTCAMVLRSPHGHALVKSIDTSTAASMPGVVGILTYEDLRGKVGDIRPNWVVGHSIVPAHPPLADGRVRYVGEAVALVVANTRQQAADALEAIFVDYEVLPAVVDEEAAVQEGAPQLHDNVPRNLIGVYKAGGGDYAAAAEAADHLVQVRLINNRLIPSPIEPRAVRAVYDTAHDKLTFYLPTQVPHMSRRWLAETLGWPEHRIHLIAPDIGGGFGAKMHFYAEEILVAFAARHFERPVGWTETRSEAHMATTHGRAHIENVEAAVTKDGRVLGIKMRSFANLGAYLSNMATGIPTINHVSFVCGNYDIPALDGEMRLVTTNTTPVDAYRGAGRPEAAYLIERTMDAVAAKLGMDPVELRRINLIRKHQFPYRPYGHPLFLWDTGNYEGCLEAAVKEIDYNGWREKQAALRAQGRYVGIGVTCYMELVGMGSSAALKMVGFNRGGWESALLRVHSDGKVTLFSGSMPQGHGHATSYAQIVGSVLQLPIDDIDVVQGDTDRVPFGHGTFNSRSMVVGGSAAHNAAQKVLAKAKLIAATMLDTKPEHVNYAEGTFSVAGEPQARSVGFGQVARMAYVSSNLPLGMEPGLEETVFYQPEEMVAPFGSHAAVVEVDIETGEVKILDYVAVDDVGNLINPMLCHGQMHGGIAQGIGQALYEGVEYDETGQLLTGSLLDYAVPKSDQVPMMRTSFQVTPTTVNPLGVKGIGEAGCVGAPPAIVSAVCDALKSFGITHIDMPLTPPKVWRAIRAAQTAGKQELTQ